MVETRSKTVRDYLDRGMSAMLIVLPREARTASQQFRLILLSILPPQAKKVLGAADENSAGLEGRAGHARFP